MRNCALLFASLMLPFFFLLLPSIFNANRFRESIEERKKDVKKIDFKENEV